MKIEIFDRLFRKKAERCAKCGKRLSEPADLEIKVKDAGMPRNLLRGGEVGAFYYGKVR
jgi:hypothetical protein